MPLCTCGSQRTILWNWFPPSIFMWVLGIKLRSCGFYGEHLYGQSSQPALTLFLKKGSLGDEDKLGWSVRVQRSPDSERATAFGFYVSAGDQTRVLMLA